MEFVPSKNNALFVHVPRTGGSSIIKNLSYSMDHLRTLDHNLRNPNYKYLKDYSKKLRNKMFIFSFIRNPWDRVVSSFFYLNEGGNNAEDEKDRIKYLEKYNGNFAKFVKNGFKDGQIFNQIHFKPQNEWICDKEGNILVDFLGKYENFDRDLKSLSSNLKVDVGHLLRTNSSNHDYYKKYYNRKTKKIVAKAYAKDIEIFDYEF